MGRFKTLFGGTFNAEAVEPQAPRDFEPLPPGTYEAEITDASVGDLKSGNGVGLKVEYTTLSPANRKVWQHINLKHSNERAQQIGQAQMSALCHATGVMSVEDEDQLFGKMVRIRVRIRPAEGQYAASNDVTSVESMGLPQMPSPAKPTKPAGTTATKPWERKA